MTVIPPLVPGLRPMPRKTRQDRSAFEAVLQGEEPEEDNERADANLAALGTPLTSLQTLNALAAMAEEPKPKAPARMAYGEKAPAPRRKTERRRAKAENENYTGEDRRKNDRRGKRS